MPQEATPQAKIPEFFYHIIALLVSIIVVHSIYVTMIRPQAEAQLRAQQELQASGQDFVAERSLAIVLKDFEQEACFILMFWVLTIMGLKTQQMAKQRRILNDPLITINEGSRVLPEDSRQYSRSIENLPNDKQEMLLPRTLLGCLHRFQASGSLQDAAAAVKENCDIEAEKLDSELAMVRYIAWAIPSIGFIGTVRGIGDALGQAHKAVAGDIAGVTASLGVAFNSTFTALVISIVIMFFIHQLQQSQEKLVLDTQRFCDNRLLRFLQSQ